MNESQMQPKTESTAERKRQPLSPPSLARLTICYQMALRAGEDGRETLSSSYLAGLLNVDETLVRKDMASSASSAGLMSASPRVKSSSG